MHMSLKTTGVRLCKTIAAIALSVAAITAVFVSPYLPASTFMNGFALAALIYCKIASSSTDLIASRNTSMFLSSNMWSTVLKMRL